MANLIKKNTIWLFAWVALSLLGCANTGSLGILGGSANYSMQYNSNDRKTVEILDYDFSNNGRSIYKWPPSSVIRGEIARQGGSTGYYPIPDSLYVKWRLIASGEVFEQHVRLKGLLPQEMEHKVLRFVVWDKQLYVYLTEYKQTTPSKCKEAIYKYTNNKKTFDSADDFAVFAYCDYPLQQIYPKNKFL